MIRAKSGLDENGQKITHGVIPETSWSTAILGNEFDLHNKGGRFTVTELICDTEDELKAILLYFKNSGIPITTNRNNEKIAA